MILPCREFEYYTNNRSNSFVDNGTLFLMPTLTADKLGADEVSGAVPTTMDIWGSQVTSRDHTLALNDNWPLNYLLRIIPLSLFICRVFLYFF
jgi:hypothetical protein